MEKIHFEEIDSTNKYLKDNFSKYENFTFVSASFQSNGKGREDRKWYAKTGENLLFSFILKENKYLEQFNYLSLCTAYVVSKILRNDYKIKNVSVKWPNDVYVNDNKICGILLEGSLPDYLVIGVGLNVNQTEFKGEFKTTPTSLKLLTSNTIDIENLKSKIYDELILEFEKIANGDYSFINDIKKIDYLKNKKCYLSNYQSNKEIKVIGIQDDCSLLIENENKKIKISSGEIFI